MVQPLRNRLHRPCGILEVGQVPDLLSGPEPPLGRLATSARAASRLASGSSVPCNHRVGAPGGPRLLHCRVDGLHRDPAGVGGRPRQLSGDELLRGHASHLPGDQRSNSRHPQEGQLGRQPRIAGPARHSRHLRIKEHQALDGPRQPESMHHRQDAAHRVPDEDDGTLRLACQKLARPRPCAKVVGAPEVVDAAPLRGGHQPRGRVLRYACRGPLLERGHECVLCQVLGELHVTGHPGESADEAGRLGPPRGDDGPGRIVRTPLCRHEASVVSNVQAPGASGPVEIWRSVEITVTSGQCLAWSSANSRWSATASSTLSYCRMAQPPTTSLASA